MFWTDPYRTRQRVALKDYITAVLSRGSPMGVRLSRIYLQALLCAEVMKGYFRYSLPVRRSLYAPNYKRHTATSHNGLSPCFSWSLDKIRAEYINIQLFRFDYVRSSTIQNVQDTQRDWKRNRAGRVMVHML